MSRGEEQGYEVPQAQPGQDASGHIAHPAVIHQGQRRAGKDLVDPLVRVDGDCRPLPDSIRSHRKRDDREQIEATTSQEEHEDRCADVELHLHAQTPQMVAALDQSCRWQVRVEEKVRSRLVGTGPMTDDQHGHGEPCQRQDPREPPDQEVPHVLVARQERGDEKTGEDEEQHHTRRSRHCVEAQPVRSQWKEVAREDQEDAGGPPAVEHSVTLAFSLAHSGSASFRLC